MSERPTPAVLLLLAVEDQALDGCPGGMPRLAADDYDGGHFAREGPDKDLHAFPMHEVQDAAPRHAAVAIHASSSTCFLWKMKHGSPEGSTVQPTDDGLELCHSAALPVDESASMHCKSRVAVNFWGTITSAERLVRVSESSSEQEICTKTINFVFSGYHP